MDGASVVVMLDRVSLFATPYGTFFQAFCKQATPTSEIIKAFKTMLLSAQAIPQPRKCVPLRYVFTNAEA